MLAHIRHWIAKQFEPGRRAGTASTLVVWACVAFFLASNLIWPVRLKDWSPEYHRVQKLFDEANAARDPAEGQRLLAEANAENARVQTAATQNIAEDGQ